MTIKYKYGFNFNGILYAWKSKNLFRLPQMIGKRFYPLKELKIIKVGNRKGYLVGCKRKSVEQLKDMTVFINYEHQEIKDSDCPF